MDYDDNSCRNRRAYTLEDDAPYFRVCPAAGGLIVESAKYNELSDRAVRTRYVLIQKETFAADIGSIVSMEMLKY